MLRELESPEVVNPLATPPADDEGTFSRLPDVFASRTPPGNPSSKGGDAAGQPRKSPTRRTPEPATEPSLRSRKDMRDQPAYTSSAPVSPRTDRGTKRDVLHTSSTEQVTSEIVEVPPSTPGEERPNKRRPMPHGLSSPPPSRESSPGVGEMLAPERLRSRIPILSSLAPTAKEFPAAAKPVRRSYLPKRQSPLKDVKPGVENVSKRAVPAVERSARPPSKPMTSRPSLGARSGSELASSPSPTPSSRYPYRQ